jgi:hypothetical protein
MFSSSFTKRLITVYIFVLYVFLLIVLPILLLLHHPLIVVVVKYEWQGENARRCTARVAVSSNPHSLPAPPPNGEGRAVGVKAAEHREGAVKQTTSQNRVSQTIDSLHYKPTHSA